MLALVLVLVQVQVLRVSPLLLLLSVVEMVCKVASMVLRRALLRHQLIIPGLVRVVLHYNQRTEQYD
jgi:hypothetical protein